MSGIENRGEGHEGCVYINNNQVFDWVLDYANRLDNFKTTTQFISKERLH